MLRNRGVNVTERRIRRDVMRAYKHDIFDVKPKWLHEAGYQSNFYRQPRYCTARCSRPIYYHTPRSSVSSYTVKRVYLPDEEWGAGSAESTVYFRNPRYSTGNYCPSEAYHISGAERPYRRDLRYEGYYSGGPSPMYFDDDDYYLRRPSRYTDKKLVRKVTRKLSPIFTCDCATTSNVRELKKNNKNDTDHKVHHNDLSKEAKELSRDVFNIISLLQKADGEDEEQFSSASLVQNIHNLDCHSSNSFAKLITQRVNVYSKMEKQKPDDPLTRFKTASGVRSKLEALVDALKQCETEKNFNGDSWNYENAPKYRNVILSDPPSVETQSFSNGKYLESSTIIYGGKQKDIVLQTEQPKTSNKSVCGKVKLKKGDSSAERKTLISRLSWRKKEGSGIKMRRDSANERLADKKTERKRSLFFKTKSRSNIRSIIETEQFQSEKSDVAQQGQPTNKAGLMIQIGGNSKRKKSASPEKFKEKKPKPWIRKFVEEKQDAKNNIRVRWNNKAFYAKSSSTIVELIHNVYKQMGINNNTKSNETSTSKHEKPPKMTAHKHSKTRMQKSPKKPKYKQKLAAYMMPQIIVPGPFYAPNVTNEDTEKCISKPPETSYLNRFTPTFYNGVFTTNELSTNYFEILLPENFIDPVLTSEELISNKEYKRVQYEATTSDAFEEILINNLNRMDVDQEDLKESVSFEAIENMHANVVQMNSNSLFSPKRCEHSEANVIRKKCESEPTKPRTQIQELSAEEAESQFYARSFCSSAEKFIQAECLHWIPMSTKSFLWAVNCEELDEVMTKTVLRRIQTSSINDDISNKTDTNTATESRNYTENNATNKVARKYSKEVYITRKFSAFNNNLVQWKKRVTGTFSDSIIGIISRKSIVMSVLWSLFKLLTMNHSSELRGGPPPQDLSLVQPPGTVSQPDCSHKTQNLYLPRRPCYLKPKITVEPLRVAQLSSDALQVKKEVTLVNPPLISIQFGFNLANDALEIKESEYALTFDKSSESIKVVESVQATVSDETNIELDISPTPCKPSCHIRLVRSLTNLKPQRNIKPKAIRSALLLHNLNYQEKSLLLLFVRSVLYGHAGIEQTLSEEKPQLVSVAQCYAESTEYKLRNVQLELVDSNKEPKETINNSQDIIRSENSAHIVLQTLSLNKTNSVVLSKQEENLNEVNNCEKRECQNTHYNEKKKNKHLACVTQMSKIKSNTLPMDTPCHLKKNTAVKFSVEVTKGDKITKILIRNKSDKNNHLKSTNVRISQDLVVTNNAEPIKRSTKRNLRNNVKVCINISNINVKNDAQNAENHLNKPESNHAVEDQLSKEEADERQMAITEYTDLNYATDDTAGCLQNDDMNGTNKQRRITTEFNDLFTADISPTDSCLYDIAAEEYVNEILGSADKIDHTKLKKVVEMRALKNTMLFNLSAFAEMVFKREIASDHTDTYTTLRQQLKRRKMIVSILSEINMRNITDDSGQQGKTGKDYFDDLHSSVTCSLCNIFERKPIRHHVKANIPINFKVKAKRNIADDYYVPHSVSPFTQRCLELEKLLSTLKKERVSHSDTFIDIDDTGIGAILKKSMLRSIRNATENLEANPICWYCVKSMNRKSKNNQKKCQTKKRQNDDMILSYNDSSKSQKSYFTEYKLRLKNDPMKQDPIEKMYSEGMTSDILQSCKIKKAVLQLYSDEAVNEGYLVAKIPKYLR